MYTPRRFEMLFKMEQKHRITISLTKDQVAALPPAQVDSHRVLLALKLPLTKLAPPKKRRKKESKHEKIR